MRASPKDPCNPKSIYLSLKVVSILVLWGQSIYYLATWILWACQFRCSVGLQGWEFSTLRGLEPASILQNSKIWDPAKGGGPNTRVDGQNPAWP